MTEKGPLALAAWLLLLGAVATLFVPGCSENGQTGNCPDLSLYNINNAGERNSPEVQAERAKSVDAGCMTPLGDAAVSDAADGGSP